MENIFDKIFFSSVLACFRAVEASNTSGMRSHCSEHSDFGWVHSPIQYWMPVSRRCGSVVPKCQGKSTSNILTGNVHCKGCWCAYLRMCVSLCAYACVYSDIYAYVCASPEIYQYLDMSAPANGKPRTIPATAPEQRGIWQQVLASLNAEFEFCQP